MVERKSHLFLEGKVEVGVMCGCKGQWSRLLDSYGLSNHCYPTTSSQTGYLQQFFSGYFRIFLLQTMTLTGCPTIAIHPPAHRQVIYTDISAEFFPQQCKVSKTWKKQCFKTQLQSLNLFCRCHILTDSKISGEPGFEITFPILLHKPIWQSCFRTFQNTFRYSKLFKMIRNHFLSIAVHVVSEYCTP